MNNKVRENKNVTEYSSKSYCESTLYKCDDIILEFIYSV